VLVGIDPRNKQRRHGSKLARHGEAFDYEGALLRLRQIREGTRDQLDSFSERFIGQIREHGYGKPYAAKDAVDAAGYVARITGPARNVAINRAGVIGELRPYLERAGYRLMNTYLGRYPHRDEAEKVLSHYWQLPEVSREAAYLSFTIQRPDQATGRKDYAALLGVSAAAAEDGSMVFLQHTSNVGMLLREARRVVLIVGVDKIVRTRDDAVFQVRSMGAYGLESVILDLSLPDASEEAPELERLPSEELPPEIHIIVLDNGRRELARKAEFAELLTCISCRACAVHCPTHNYFNIDLGNYPRQYLWSYLLGMNPSLELCVGCGMCTAQCPLGIDIPRLIAMARSEGLARWNEGIPHRVLYDAWLAMRAAHLAAPLANGVLRNKASRGLIERLVGFQRDAWVPEAQARTFLRGFRQRQSEGGQV